MENADNVGSDCVRHGVLDARKQHAGTSCARRGKQCAEIHVVGEQDMGVVACPQHDLGVGRSRITNITPMGAIETGLLQERYPGGRQVHVEQDLHGSGSSVSWVRQAA